MGDLRSQIGPLAQEGARRREPCDGDLLRFRVAQAWNHQGLRVEGGQMVPDRGGRGPACDGGLRHDFGVSSQAEVLWRGARGFHDAGQVNS